MIMTSTQVVAYSSFIEIFYHMQNMQYLILVIYFISVNKLRCVCMCK